MSFSGRKINDLLLTKQGAPYTWQLKLHVHLLTIAQSSYRHGLAEDLSVPVSIKQFGLKAEGLGWSENFLTHTCWLGWKALTSWGLDTAGLGHHCLFLRQSLTEWMKKYMTQLSV